MKYIHVENAADIIQYIPAKNDGIKGTTRDIQYLCTEHSYFAKYNQCQKAELISYFWFKYWMNSPGIDWRAEYKRIIKYNTHKRRIRVIPRPDMTVSIPCKAPSDKWLIHIDEKVYESLPEVIANRKSYKERLKARLNHLNTPEMARILGLTEEEFYTDLNLMRQCLLVDPLVSDYQIVQFMNYVISPAYRALLKSRRNWGRKYFTYDDFIKGQQRQAKHQLRLNSLKEKD